MFLDNAVCHVQTKSGPFPHRLGGKERIKYLRHDLRRNALPGVADPYLHHAVIPVEIRRAYSLTRDGRAFKPGEPVIPSPKGDLLTLVSDPYLPGGMKSRSFDENGLAPSKTTVVENNVFKRHTANKRYADYLNIEATGDFANLIIPPGSRTIDELLSDGPLLHILKFSTFEPNSVTGAFSGEIRLGYLVEGEKRTPIKGGAVAGVMTEAMKEVYFSKETTKRESYCGPLAIRVQNLNVSGR